MRRSAALRVGRLELAVVRGWRVGDASAKWGTCESAIGFAWAVFFGPFFYTMG